MAVQFLGLIVLALIVVLGLILILFGLPGTIIIAVAPLFYDLVTWSLDISIATVAALVGIALLGELFDVVASGIAVKQSGTSSIGVLGAVLGGVIGGAVGLPIPIIGSIAGIFFGAFLGAFAFELIHYHDVEKAWRAGKAAFVGRLVSTFVKLALAAVMVVMLIIALWW
ncbi:MAG TPA: DUF456 domain-containing protein [Candidatus Binatia bacterium]|nr:DUF456 domain-containing protein [Candidatus Binatia bacterium]